MRSSQAVIASSLIAILLVALAWAIYGTGALTFTGSDPSSKVVSATLALIGVVLAAVVTLVGYLLKHSIDRQTEARLSADTRRIESQAREAEERLKLEAAIRAVQLLGTSKEEAADDSVQRAGAVIALSSLQQHELAMALTQELLERDAIGSTAATHVLDRALLSGVQSVQIDAVNILISQSAKFVTCSGFTLPAALLTSPKDQPAFVRQWLPDIIGRVFVARPLDEWREKHPSAAHSLIAVLGLAWQREDDDVIKRDMAVVLRELIPLFSWARAGRMKVINDELRLAEVLPSIQHVLPGTDTVIRLLGSLREWRGEQPSPGPAA